MLRPLAFFLLGALAAALLTTAFAQQHDAAAATRARLLEVVSDALQDVEVFEAHGFRIRSAQASELGADLQANGNEFQLLHLSAEGMFKVAVEKGRSAPASGGIALLHPASGMPMVSASDQDGDGRIDILTYGIVDEDGEHLLDVIDYEADGQADLRMNFRENYFELWHDERWHRGVVRDGVRGVVVDGEFQPVERSDKRLIVP